jgi:hypothetical protein
LSVWEASTANSWGNVPHLTLELSSFPIRTLAVLPPSAQEELVMALVKLVKATAHEAVAGAGAEVEVEERVGARGLNLREQTN